MLLLVLQKLAEVWGIQRIRAVSNAKIVFRDFRLRKETIIANYDESWLECVGTLDPDGSFSLPITDPPRD